MERALNYEEEDKTLKEMSDLLQMLMKHTASRKECVKALYATRNDNTE